MTFFDHFKGIYGLSACFWLLFGVIKIFSVSKFIVKRYEQETNLLDTVFFKEHFTFARYQTNFHASGLYAMHLIMCTWGWKVYGKKKIFRDISDPQKITQYFSNEEIRRVKRLIIYSLITFLHGIAYFVFQYIWPEHFPPLFD